MAEKVVENLEDFLSISDALIRGGIFDEAELRQIVEQRTKYEYRICKRHPQKEDFLSYIKYDSALLLLMNKRIKKIKFSHGDAILTRQFERLHYMFNNYHKKYQNDLEIYDQHIYLCHRLNENFMLSQVLSEMLRRNLKSVDAWKMASKWYTINNNLEMSEKLYEKALVVLKNDVDVWSALVEFRLLKTIHSKKYQNTQLVEVVSGIVQEALKECDYNEKILLYITQFTQNQIFHYDLLLALLQKIFDAKKMDLCLLKILTEAMCKCPLELGSELIDRVTVIRDSLSKIQPQDDAIKPVDLVKLFSENLLHLFGENIDQLSFDLADKCTQQIKTLYQSLVIENQETYPYSSEVAENIINAYVLVDKHSHHEATTRVYPLLERFCEIYPQNSSLWLMYLNYESKVLCDLIDLTRWQGVFVRCGSFLTDQHAKEAVSNLTGKIKSLLKPTEKQNNNHRELVNRFFIEFTPIFHKSYRLSINHLFACLLPMVSLNDELLEQVQTNINVNYLDVGLMEVLADCFIFSNAIDCKSRKRLPFVQRLFELMVSRTSALPTTSSNIDKWLSYIRFEKRLFDLSYTSSMSHVSNLYSRALRSLDSSLVEEFVTKYTLANTATPI